LVEHSFSGSSCQSSVIGIGVNINQSEFPEELIDIATSIKALGYNFECFKILPNLIDNILNFLSPTISYEVGYIGKLPIMLKSCICVLEQYKHLNHNITGECKMERIRLTDDIRPLSDFRAEAATCIKHVHDTKRPMVITQRGKGVAVLLDINEYESLREKIELLQDIYKAERQIESDKVISHKQAKASILKRLKNEG
jgi:prevent-host-death family protein